MKKKNRRIIKIPILSIVFILAIVLIIINHTKAKTEKSLIVAKENHFGTDYVGTSEWYKDYTYTLNETDSTITLKKYNGEATEVVVPGTAVIDGKTYNTLIQSGVYDGNKVITSVQFEKGVSGSNSLEYLFYNCSNLTQLDLRYFDTAKVTNMSKMFYKCTSLTSLDLSNFNTSNVTNMSKMFYNCTALTELNVSNFDTSNVTNMSHIFSNCSSLENLNISNINTSKVTNMEYMFKKCSSLTNLDVSKFNTSNVTNMELMFSRM